MSKRIAVIFKYNALDNGPQDTILLDQEVVERRMKMKTFAKLFLIIVLLAAMTACTETTPNPNPKPSKPIEGNNSAGIIATTIADFKGHTGLVVKAEEEKNDGTSVLATGTVDTDGNVKIELPNEVAISLLEAFETDIGCQFSPATTAKAYFSLGLAVYQGDVPVGILNQTTTTNSIMRVFLTEDATIVCTDANANASFKKGWNLVSIDSVTKKGKILTSSTIPWVFTGTLVDLNPNPKPNPSDTTAPLLLSSKSINNTTVELVFSEAIEGGNNIAAYSIIIADATLSPLAVTAASVSADKTTVTLTTASQQEASYGFTRINLNDAAGNSVDLTASGSGPLNFFGTGDNTPPPAKVRPPTVAQVEADCAGSFDTSATEEPLVVTVQGTKAIFRGLIDGTTPAKITNLINNSPEVRTIVLAYGPGSDDDDANLQASLALHNADFATCVPDGGEIASGAVDMFLAGKVRRLGEDTFVGVHSWADGNGTEGGDLPMNDAQHKSYLDYYAAIGVPAEFYWFTLDAAPSDGIHDMTEAERVQYGMETPKYFTFIGE